MSEIANTLDLVVRNALLQSTLIFLAGLLLARFAVRRPARVHTVLVLAFLAAVIAPVASEAVRRGGWGLLPPAPVQSTASPGKIKAVVKAIDSGSDLARNLPPTTTHTLPGETNADPTMIDGHRPADAEPLGRPLATQQQAASQPVLVPTIVVDAARRPWQHDMVFASIALLWLAASALLAWRLVRGVVAGRRVVRTATPCEAPAVLAALTAACDRLGMNGMRVDVYESSAVRCPMIWCWAARPRCCFPSTRRTSGRPPRGSRFSVTSWRIGNGAITCRPSSRKPYVACCPGKCLPGGPNAGWSTPANKPATTGP